LRVVKRMAETGKPRSREFGSVVPTEKTKHLPASKQQFRGRYTYRGKKYEAEGGPFLTKQLARRALNQVQLEIQAGEWRPPLVEGEVDPKKMTLWDLSEHYIKSRININTGKGLRDTTSKEYRRYLTSPLAVAHLANRPIQSITEQEVTKWTLDKRAEGKIPQAAKVYDFLSALFNHAIRKKFLRESPCQLIGGSSIPLKIRPIATPAEQQLIIQGLEFPFQLATALGALSGARTAEILALQYKDLIPRINDLGETRWTMNVDKALDWSAGSGDPQYGETKNTGSMGKKPLQKDLNPYIEAHLRELGEVTPETPLFTNPNQPGKLFGRNTLLNAYHKVTKRYGLPYSFHDTRSFMWTHTGKTLGRGELMALSGIRNPKVLDRYTKTTGLEQAVEELSFFE
jgi:integrase